MMHVWLVKFLLISSKNRKNPLLAEKFAVVKAEKICYNVCNVILRSVAIAAVIM